MQTISSSLASSAVLSTLTREGCSFVFSVAPKTPHDRILAYGQFMAKPQNAFNSHRNDHNSRFSERSQDRNTFRKNSSYAMWAHPHEEGRTRNMCVCVCVCVNINCLCCSMRTAIDCVVKCGHNLWQLSSRLGGVNTRQSTLSKGSGEAHGRAWQHGPRAVGES